MVVRGDPERRARHLAHRVRCSRGRASRPWACRSSRWCRSAAPAVCRCADWRWPEPARTGASRRRSAAWRFPRQADAGPLGRDNAGLTGVTAAPNRHAANSETTNSTVFGSLIATTARPSARLGCSSVAAARLRRRRNSALFRSLLSSAACPSDRASRADLARPTNPCDSLSDRLPVSPATLGTRRQNGMVDAQMPGTVCRPKTTRALIWPRQAGRGRSTVKV